MHSVNKKRSVSRRVVPHDEFIERVRKTLYFGNDSLAADLEISRPLADYSAELFSEAHRGHSLNRLHSVAAGSVHATPCSLLLALIYLDRLNTADPTYLRRITPQELFIVSMMISTKFHKGHDELICVADWAKDGNISEKRLKRLELDFLSVIDWNVYVSNQQFFEKLEHVELQLALREGLKRGWLTYTEMIQMLPSFTLAKLLLNNLAILTLTYTASLVTLASALLMVNQIATTTTTILSQNIPVNRTSSGLTNVSNGTSHGVLINTAEKDDSCALEIIDDAESEINSYIQQMAEVCLNDKQNENTLSTNWNIDFLFELYKSVYHLDSTDLIYKRMQINDSMTHNEVEKHHKDNATFDYIFKNVLKYEIALEMVEILLERISIF